jgi:hypothetical protein
MKRALLMMLLVLGAGVGLGGCARFEGWHRPDITTGEPDERNEINRGILDTDDSFGTGMGHAEHHMDW